MTITPDALPVWLTWQHRPFPDANLMLVHGEEAALVDTGFVGHATDTMEWAEGLAGSVALVVNTHWHSDHIGGNALLQTKGALVAASATDAESIGRRDPGCCSSERLDQPVAPYTIDRPLVDGQVIGLGDSEWQVVRTPGHTPGHLCLWHSDNRILAVGDALSDYDVGWVDLALDGADAAATALKSLHRLVDLAPRILLPSHGQVPGDAGAALDAAVRRTQRLVDDPAGAVWYGARRIFAFALMIRGGMTVAEVEPYLLRRAWLVDAAHLLALTPEDLAAELVDSMRRAGAVTVESGRLVAAAPHAPVKPATLDQPLPREWD